MPKAEKLATQSQAPERKVTFGVFATCDPRIDKASRKRAANIVSMAADVIAQRVKMPDGSQVRVVWSPVLVDGEVEADIVARQLGDAGADALVCVPDTWAFPQLTTISLLHRAHSPTGVSLSRVTK